MNIHYGYGKVLDDPFGSHSDTVCGFFFFVLKASKENARESLLSLNILKCTRPNSSHSGV